MTKAERAVKYFVEMTWPFDINTDTTTIRLDATVEQMAKLVAAIQIRPDMANWSVEPVHPEFLGWSVEEIAEHLED